VTYKTPLELTVGADNKKAKGYREGLKHVTAMFVRVDTERNRPELRMFTLDELHDPDLAHSGDFVHAPRTETFKRQNVVGVMAYSMKETAPQLRLIARDIILEQLEPMFREKEITVVFEPEDFPEHLRQLPMWPRTRFEVVFPVQFGLAADMQCLTSFFMGTQPPNANYTHGEIAVQNIDGGSSTSSSLN